MDLPVYQLRINPDDASPSEVEYIAMVDHPAIERNFLKFSKDVKQRFATDTERRIITGPIMLADTPIYRAACKDTMGREIPEHYIVFTKDVIEQAVMKYMRKQYTDRVNLMHNQGLVPEGVYVFEMFIADAARGVQPLKGFEDVPDGTAFASMKVDNDLVWAGVLDGSFQGYSVEGLFQYPEPVVTKQQRWDAFEKSFWALVQERGDVLIEG